MATRMKGFERNQHAILADAKQDSRRERDDHKTDVYEVGFRARTTPGAFANVAPLPVEEAARPKVQKKKKLVRKVKKD